MDEREKTSETRSFPHSVHWVVLIPTGKEGEILWGTGIMIGPNVVLTAAHNLYDSQQPERRKYPKIQFIPEINGEKAPFGIFDVGSDRIYVRETYISYQSEKIYGAYPDNYGIFILRESVGLKTGYFGLKTALKEVHRCVDMQLLGYPGDKVRGTQGVYELLGACGKIVAFDQQGGILTHEISTYPGQSGSGLFVQEDSEHFSVIGVHIFGKREFNTANGISQQIISQIKDWIQSDSQRHHDEAQNKFCQCFMSVLGPKVVLDEPTRKEETVY